jgi:hypothetical protein
LIHGFASRAHSLAENSYLVHACTHACTTRRLMNCGEYYYSCFFLSLTFSSSQVYFPTPRNLCTSLSIIIPPAHLSQNPYLVPLGLVLSPMGFRGGFRGLGDL